jgi:hypothetical protein
MRLPSNGGGAGGSAAKSSRLRVAISASGMIPLKYGAQQFEQLRACTNISLDDWGQTKAYLQIPSGGLDAHEPITVRQANKDESNFASL